MGVVHASDVVGELVVTPVTIGRFKENCYVVADSSPECLLVDPGSDAAFIEQHLDERGLRPAKIVLTHGHFDHLGAVEALMRRYSVPCEVHRREERLIRQAGTYAFRFAREALRVPRGLAFFDDVTMLDWNGRRIEVIPTPGHTSGSVTFNLGGACAFTGDTLFRERIGPTTYPESDREAILVSVPALLSGLPDACILYPGHGRPWNAGAARAWWSDLAGDVPARTIF
jgi:hydroxyacylglutathione hydrolase